MERIGGKYEIIKVLGSGATATVYLAFDPFAEREVAVKWIHPETLRDPERGRQFRHLLMNEASLAGRLHHPHIVEIYDAVVSDAESYIVMEFVPGGTLERFCRPGVMLPIERVIEVVFKCSRALDYAHRLGITHRDIKPANILLVHPDAEGGEIKISDFGACIVESGDETQTQVLGVGSPAYMSPEQARGEALDFRTDIFSLGIVLYQLLTGQLPFTGSNHYAVIQSICHHEPPPPSRLRPGIPPALDAIVLRALAKRLESRYPSWDAFARELSRTLPLAETAEIPRELPESAKFESLRTLPFFAAFSDVELWEVVRFGLWQTLPGGTVVVRDGEAGDEFYFVLDGAVLVSKENRPLGTLGRGEVFGEMAILDPRHPGRAADVVTLSPTRLVAIPGQALRQASPACRMHFYEAFLGVLAERLARTNVMLAHA